VQWGDTIIFGLNKNVLVLLILSLMDNYPHHLVFLDSNYYD
jgi:hypothetical protein